MTEPASVAKSPSPSVLLSAVQQTGVAFVFCGADRRIEWVNDAFTDVTGYTLDEVVGKLTRELTLAAGLVGTVIDGNLMNLIKNGEVRFETEIVHKSGAIITVDIWFREVKDMDGNLQAFLISAIDISELSRTKTRLSALMENATTGIVVQNHKGTIQEANPEAERLLGLSLDQMKGRASVDPEWRAIREDGSDYPGEEHPAMRTLKDGEPVQDDIMGIETPDGDQRWISVNARAFVNERDGRRNVVTSFSDVTAAKAREHLLLIATEEKDEARRKAEEATRSKSEFLATMSHEIRTPLNGVMGMLQLLARTDLEPAQNELIETAYDSANGLLRLLNDILDYSKIESGKIDIEVRKFNPAAELSKVLGLMEPRIDEKGLSLSVDLPEEEVAFHGDSGRFGQVVLNLVGNAIKFTHQGGIELSLRYINNDRPRVRIEIRDSGIGISKDGQEHLFNRFSQADSSITRRFEGTGLGLAICKEIVDLMDGTIGLFSDGETGSTFWFEIPSSNAALSQTEEEETPTVVQAIPIDGQRPNVLNILVAEDHPVNQRIVKSTLEALGHTTTIVENGKEAILALRDQSYDLALIDIHMPVLDGLSSVRLIRSAEDQADRLTIFAMTADVLPEHKERFLTAGFDGIVEKPLDLQTLANVVTSVGNLIVADGEELTQAAG